MTQSVKNKCDLFAENYNIIKKAYPWEYHLMHFICAYIYTSQDRLVNTDAINECRNIIKRSQNLFSTFRNALLSVFACKLSVGQKPEESFDAVCQAHNSLKDKFMVSSYRAVAAFVLAENS